jgi:DNA-binding response OmpR family regulator
MWQDSSEHKWALIIEDEPTISRACQKVLMAEGFDVDIARNGLIAQELISTKSYDLCLSDIRLPKLNGVDLYRYIEQEHPTLAEKVIFTTGDLLSQDISMFLEEVDRPFLPKPFTPDELKCVLKEF